MAKKIDYASLYTLRKDGRYQGSYTDNKGRHYVYDRDPEQLHKKLECLAENRGAPKIPTVRDVAEAWEKEHREDITERTWKNYDPHYQNILSIHGRKPFPELTALDVSNDLKRAKAKGLSATVVNTIRSLYNMIFDYAVVHGHSQYNPVSSIKLPKGLKRGKRTAPTDDQIKTICRNIDKPFGFFPFFLLCTGMRKSEALALQWADVDFDNKTISVTKSVDYTNGANPKYKPPKTEAGNRLVPIIDVLIPYLEAEKQKSNSEYMFPSEHSNRGGSGGGLMTERAYEGAWMRYCKQVGLMNGSKPSLTAHQLRHGTATLMFENKVDEKTAQKVLGHSRVEITREIYTELRAAQQMQSINMFSDGMAELLSEARK